MELRKVVISESMGEAQMEFSYEERFLRIYENKQNSDAAFDMQVDGEKIETIEMFQNREILTILEVDGDKKSSFYIVQLRQGNAYYCIMSDLNLDSFEEIIKGIYFAEI